MMKLSKEDKVFLYCLLIVGVIFFIFSFYGIKLKMEGQTTTNADSNNCPPFIMPRHPPTPALPSISPEAMANKEILSSILIDHVTSLNKYIRNVKTRNNDAYNIYIACHNNVVNTPLPPAAPPPETLESNNIKELENLN